MSNTDIDTDTDATEAIAAEAVTVEAVASPMDMVEFFTQAAATLTGPKKNLDEAAAEAESVRHEGDQRIQAVTAEVAKDHNLALDAEEEARTAYNAALDEVLSQQIITKQALAKMGFKTAPGRKGRRPGK